MIHAIRRGLAELVSFVLPRLCCGCGERILEYSRVVCQPCMDQVSALLEPICITCGCPDAKILEPGKCANCLPGKTWFRRARAVAPFSGIAQIVVFRLKYQSRAEYAEVLAKLMLGKLKPEPAGDADASSEDEKVAYDIVVPVPLHSARERQRGFNQSALLGRIIAREQGLIFSPRALRRTRPTATQTRLKKRARRKNVEGAFKCKRPAEVAGKRVLLIDDVYTTGSTLNECARVLMEAGAESVECLAFARAVLE
jgi:ComF family protein